MKTIVLLLAGLAISSPSFAASDAGANLAVTASLAAETINRAGEQRMLVQRIAKSFIQIGLNVLPVAAKIELDIAAQRFDDNLGALEPLARDGDAPGALAALRSSWLVLKQATRGATRRENAILLSHFADETLAAAERLTRALQNSVAPAAANRLVALAGRQRMLSQKMTKAYLLISWDDASEATQEELDTAVHEFSGALAVLKGRSENTPAIERELDDMTLQWEWLQAAMASDGASSYRLIVAEASESILQSADRLTLLYQQLSQH
jgi:hypothetical protein